MIVLGRYSATRTATRKAPPMSHVILIALTLDEVGDADDADLVAGVIARLEEFYPTADPVNPSRVSAVVVSPAVAHHIDGALEVGLDGEDTLTQRDAIDAVLALQISAHGR